MRIAQWVHVSHGARDLARWNIENLSELRGIQVTLRAYLNSGIATLGYKRRQPANLQLQTDHHQQVGLPQL